MSLDREKTFANAERLLKAGKVQQALEECRRLADDAPKDLLMLNRVGDLLARSGRGAEAIGYYDRIADQFSASGFYPKAIAILKKVVKVDPGRTAAIVRLGELNMKQKLPGEARAWLLQAAETYLRSRDYPRAREVYEKLVAAEPDNFVHGIRLAEARAAEGDAERAGRELVALGARMVAAGRTDDAERTYRRALELLPGHTGSMVGLAQCHDAAGRREEATRLVDEAWARESGGGAAGEIFLLLEKMGDHPRAARLLQDPKSDGITDEALERVFRGALARGDVGDLWNRVMPLFDRWTRERQFERATHTLERIARLEEGGHLRAIEQIVEIRKAEGNRAAAARALERLIRACQARGRTETIGALLETLKLFDPTSPILFVGRPAPSPAAPEAAPVAPARPAPEPASHGPALPVAFEAPAVPLGAADEEFVSGHLTEAEVFEKYGLRNEALQQLRQVTTRFPGHVPSQEKLIGFLRTQSDRGALRDGLVGLAFARRAAGDGDAARRAATEASQIGGIEAAARGALERLGLLSATAAAAPAPAEPPRPAKPAAPARAAPSPAPPPPVRTPAPTARDEEEELEILFDDAEEVEASPASSGEEILEEIEFYIAQGMIEDAVRRIAEARKSGAAGAALDALESRARATAPGTDRAIIEEDGDKLDEEDLSSIAAALETEYGTDRAAEPGAQGSTEATEQSVDEVFSAFKEHVKAQVDAGDYRTHYDLGIAYKEMGLVDDALAEFRVATGAPELYRDACSMLGLCHWERGEADEAIRWYRAALSAPGEEETPLSGLRYDLAEILAQTGDERGAFDLYSEVLAVEPAYRDVQDRVADLRRRLQL